MPASSDTHLIALGGGGFSMEPDSPLLDQYILGLTHKPGLLVLGLLPELTGLSDKMVGYRKPLWTQCIWVAEWPQVYALLTPV